MLKESFVRDKQDHSACLLSEDKPRNLPQCQKDTPAHTVEIQIHPTSESAYLESQKRIQPLTEYSHDDSRERRAHKKEEN